MDEIEKRKEIYSQVLSRLALPPEVESRLHSTVEGIIAAVEEEASATGVKVEPVLVGSVAKGTWAGEPDIDVFMLFDPGVPKEEMEEWGLRTGKKILPEWEERYAEHPYVHGYLNGFEVDLVPAYKIEITDERRIISSVDRTPLHTRFVMENLEESQRDEVRLLKRFMKGAGVYGADAGTEGFSGYLCELLIIRYGDFESVLKASSGWRAGTALSLDGKKSRRFDSPFVFIDPVDAGRNVASAVSLQSLGLFIYAASEFMRRPDMAFFFPRPPEPLPSEELRDMARSRGTDIILISSERPDVIDDILLPQVKKFVRSALRALEVEDFVPYGSAYWVTDAGISVLLELESATLPRVKKHEGPPAWVGNSSEFLERWSGNCINGPYLENGRWFADIERRHADAVSLLNERFSAGLGKDIPPPVVINRLTDFSVLDEEAALLLTSYLQRKFPWEL